MRTSSLAIRISAKVASTCDRWSRAYSRRSTRHLEQHADRARCRRRASTTPSQNDPVACGERGGEVRADHVQRAVREVDHVHDPEHERQPGGEQEQHQPELQAVQGLLEEQDSGHACQWGAEAVRGDASPLSDRAQRAYFILQSCTYASPRLVKHRADRLVGDACRRRVLADDAQVVVLHRELVAR